MMIWAMIDVEPLSYTNVMDADVVLMMMAMVVKIMNKIVVLMLLIMMVI